MKVPEKYRVKDGPMGTNETYGNNGLFIIQKSAAKKIKNKLTVIASDGRGWDHVSISRVDKTPTWDEMCFIKDMFFGDEVVIQYHPKKEDYINNHKYCLHLWRPTDGNIPTPPKEMVGIK